MLRFLLRLTMLAWLCFIGLMLVMLGIGKTAPEISKIAFFEQETLGTPYWRLDLFTGVSFEDRYEASVWITELDRIFNNPIEHFLTIDRRVNYYRVYENHLDTHEISFIGEYAPPEYGDVLLAGDYLFFYYHEDGLWMRINLENGTTENFHFGLFGDFHQISPDGNWIARRVNNNYHFVNVEDGRGYQAPIYREIRWSPDSKWYIAAYYEAEQAKQVFSVLSTEDGSSHPNLPASIAAENTLWSDDGQSIIFDNSNELSSISLQTAEIHPFGFAAENYWLTCLSPNQGFIISYDSAGTYLHDTESGEQIWSLIEPFSFALRCYWSEDSRYLVIYNYLNIPTGLGTNNLKERFLVIDTASRSSWDLYPRALPRLPIYLHIPDAP
jgi:hypothetical protein